MGETVSAFQVRGGRGQQDLSSDLTAVHLVCVRLGVHWQDKTKNKSQYKLISDNKHFTYKRYILIKLFVSVGYLVDCSGHPVDPPRLHHCPHQSQSMTGPAAAPWLHCHGPV